MERPIIFSAPMVRAILAGTKTQTRRIIKPQPITTKPQSISPFECPYGLPGDRLWVRETFALIDNSEFTGKDEDWHHEYRADTDGKSLPGGWPDEERENPERPKWRPSIHMPRVASRIALKVTSTRPERLHDISKADVIAEGITERGGFPIEDCHAGWHEPFAKLWEQINGAGSWSVNPLVWVVSFQRVTP